MKLIKIDEVDKISEVSFFAKKWFKSDKLEVVYITLKPGEEVQEHTSDFNVIFIVLNGRGVFKVESEEICLTNKELLSCEKGEKHGFFNPHEKDLEVIVIKYK